MKTTFIYVLKCPLSGEVRYVGKTNNPQERYREHMNIAHGEGTYRYNWVMSLRKKNLRPILEIIKEVSVDEWKYWEKYFIKYYINIGCKLVNYGKGGEGLGFGNQTSFKSGMVPWNKGIKQKIIKKCSYELCGKEFSPKDKRRVFCSRSCAVKAGQGFDSGAIPWNKGVIGYTTSKKGYSMPEEVKKRISKTLIKLYNNGYNGVAKPVLQIDPCSNRIIKEFSSTAEASRQTGILGSSISTATNGRIKTAGGFKWKKKEDL